MKNRKRLNKTQIINNQCINQVIFVYLISIKQVKMI